MSFQNKTVKHILFLKLNMRQYTCYISFMFEHRTGYISNLARRINV